MNLPKIALTDAAKRRRGLRTPTPGEGHYWVERDARQTGTPQDATSRNGHFANLSAFPTDFTKVLRDYDVILNSLGTETLNKSLEVLKPGGKLISISGLLIPISRRTRERIGSNWREAAS